jgi:excisionase family DNA binding protein
MSASPEKVEEILSYPTCTVAETASVLGVGRAQAYMQVKAGRLPVIQFGERRVLVKTAALRHMITESV